MITATINKQPKTDYPILMKSNSYVVLFESKGCGTVVCSMGGKEKPGHYSTDWVMIGFSYCTDTITLENA